MTVLTLPRQGFWSNTQTIKFFSTFVAGAAMLFASLSAAFAGTTPIDADVCTMSNAAAGNEVLCYGHDTEGGLVPTGTYQTGGLGTGTGLGNQAGIALNAAGDILLVVNAGSDSIASLHRDATGWTRVSVVASQGIKPISVAVHGDLVYVLHANGTIAGFDLDLATGALTYIPGSFHYLSANFTNPAQVAIHPDGNVLLVTEKATKKISGFSIDGDGYVTGPIANESSGETPFGFAYTSDGHAIVSEAFGGMASALSSYLVMPNGELDVISASVHAPDQAAACWVAITPDDSIAYTTNTETNTVSSYGIADDGALMLLQAVAAETGMGPIDIALSGEHVYVLTAGGHSIEVYEAGDAGALTYMTSVDVPMGSNGLIAM